MAPQGVPRRSLLLVGIANTGSLWAYNGTSDADGVTPFLTAALVTRGDAGGALAGDAALQQPEGAPALPATALPPGFWNGRVSALVLFSLHSYLL